MSTESEQSMTAQSRSNQIVGKIAVFLETYVFIGVYCYFVLQNALLLFLEAPVIRASVSQIFSRANAPDAFLALTYSVYLLALVVFNVLVVYSFIVRRGLKQAPSDAIEIVIPFLGTFGMLLFNLMPHLGEDVNMLLLPKLYLPFIVPVGLLFLLTGVIIGFVALFSLKRSFGIFVQVRDVVTQGLYRFVRHPMYCGHILMFIGFMLVSPRLINVVLALTVIILNITRAFLEERKLSLYSEEYRRYKEQTPFLIPWTK